MCLCLFWEKGGGDRGERHPSRLVLSSPECFSLLGDDEQRPPPKAFNQCGAGRALLGRSGEVLLWTRRGPEVGGILTGDVGPGLLLQLLKALLKDVGRYAGEVQRTPSDGPRPSADNITLFRRSPGPQLEDTRRERCRVLRSKLPAAAARPVSWFFVPSSFYSATNEGIRRASTRFCRRAPCTQLGAWSSTPAVFPSKQTLVCRGRACGSSFPPPKECSVSNRHSESSRSRRRRRRSRRKDDGRQDDRATQRPTGEAKRQRSSRPVLFLHLGVSEVGSCPHDPYWPDHFAQPGFQDGRAGH